MTSKYLSVALPPELYAEVEAACQRERRSRSTIVGGALAMYFAHPIPVKEPAPDELEAIREGREALARGEYVTLEGWRREVGLDRDQAGAVGPARRAGARISPASMTPSNGCAVTPLRG